ncbi:MAG: HU family DNA-binding protein [Gracilibacteraceae bacterium]|nr:HU family DNA-binding protein [Gracilibacteraceae bacterium]
MNKADLVAAVAEKTDFTKKDADKAIVAVFEAIREALGEGDKVQLVGFGTFGVRDQKERTGRNPQTKKPLKIPARKVPFFKAGKALKEGVR